MVALQSGRSSNNTAGEAVRNTDVLLQAIDVCKHVRTVVAMKGRNITELQKWKV